MAVKYKVRMPEGHYRMVDVPPVVADHQKELRAVLESPPPYPGGDGHGIIYVGGGRYWSGIVVGCRMVRELGCTWPIEVWHRGNVEPVDPKDVAGLDVTLIDATAVARKHGDNALPPSDSWRGGWEAKLYALVHTSLRRVLYLDADAYCVSSPCHLSRLLDSRPFVFWRDQPTQQSTIKWGDVLPEAETVGSVFPPVQGGQLLIDRERAWGLISTTHHICQHSTHYWQVPKDPARRLMYGDQDAWRVGLASGMCGWRDLGSARWDHIAFVCEWEGKARVVHRCQGKLFRPEDADHGHTMTGMYHARLPLEKRAHEIFREIVGKRGYAAERTFKAIYGKGLWGDGSGGGSSPAEAKPYLDIINALILERGWTTAVDAGCGDGRVTAGLRMATGLRRQSPVIACDVVPAAHRVPSPGVEVLEADIYRELEHLPSADVLLCKDVLHHWPNEWVIGWLDRLKRCLAAGRWRAAVLTFDRQTSTSADDTHLGGYRGLDPAVLGLPVHASYQQKIVCLLELATENKP